MSTLSLPPEYVEMPETPYSLGYLCIIKEGRAICAPLEQCTHRVHTYQHRVTHEWVRVARQLGTPKELLAPKPTETNPLG